MELDRATLVNIILLIHMTLTGIMLFHLFKLKNTTGGQLITTFLALMIPVLGPSVMIWFYERKLKAITKTEQKLQPKNKSKKRKHTKKQ